MGSGRKRIVIIASLALLGVGLAAWAGVGRPEAANGGSADSGSALGITVTGAGSVKATPDSSGTASMRRRPRARTRLGATPYC